MVPITMPTHSHLLTPVALLVRRRTDVDRGLSADYFGRQRIKLGDILSRYD